jgi:hypothetical protein
MAWFSILNQEFNVGRTDGKGERKENRKEQMTELNGLQCTGNGFVSA